MFGWHVPSPDEAMLISGAKQRSELPFKVVIGHGAFVMPIRSKAYFLTLAMQEAAVTDNCVSQQGIALQVEAVIAFKVGDDPESIVAAGRRFLADQNQMSTLTGRIFAGHLRSIIGSLTVENLVRDRQKLAEEVLDASKAEMAKIGLVVDSLQIQSIVDASGYIDAMAAPHVAAVNQTASIAQSVADQAAAEARQESLKNQAEYERKTAVAKAEYQAEIDRATQTAHQAGPLAAAQAQQAVLVEQALVAERNAELREAQLRAEVVKPAQAEAARITTLAEAQAAATKLTAEASAAENRISLDQAIIAQLPQMIASAAEGLANANLTVLNGATGLNDAVATLATQGLAILATVRAGLASVPVMETPLVEEVVETVSDEPDEPTG